MEDTKIDKDMLLALMAEAQQVTVMASLWTGNLPTNDPTDMALTKYYFKWIDVTKLAIENLKPDTSPETMSIMANDLSRLIVVPLKGMIEAVKAYAAQCNIIIPPADNPPGEVFAFKQWAVAYVGSVMTLFKEQKK